MLTITNVRLTDPADPLRSSKVDIHIAEERIVSITPTSASGDFPAGDLPTSALTSPTPAPPATRTIDGAGLLALPGLVNAHAHVDKSWWGHPWQSWGGELSLEGRIRWERERRAELDIPSKRITLNVLREFVRHGTTSVRTHLDVDPGIGLDGIKAAQEAFAHAKGITFQTIAFPQDGVLRREGVAELLERAAREGVDFLGGLDPAGIDRDPVGQLDLLFGIAANYGCGIDIHLHDSGELGAFELELIIARTESYGLVGKVNIAHGFALGDVSPAQQRDFVAAMAELDITLTTVAPLLQNPLPWTQMRIQGVSVGLGTDGIRDLWAPYGDGDIMAVAGKFARMHGARTDAELMAVVDIAGAAGARFVGRERADLVPGAPADLMLVDAENPMDALVRCPVPQLVLGSGHVMVADGQPVF